ncbi:hypothetical protein DPMN_087448 [Dreissena polymorpha]|uniref:Uncharacterized protein n=1 Tax=Dreissena polymorpha TaxID=45954 RepID=A0A9D4QVL4_DREPO|nr:hypothetical protein DPMN_087448 [Dreissena polymorpha]
MDLYNTESNAILSTPTYLTGLNNNSQPVPEHILQQSLLSSVNQEHDFQHMSTASYVAYPVAQAQDNGTGGQQTGLNISSAAMETLQ